MLWEEGKGQAYAHGDYDPLGDPSLCWETMTFPNPVITSNPDSLPNVKGSQILHLDSFIDFASTTRKALLLNSHPLNQTHPLEPSQMPHSPRGKRAPITQPSVDFAASVLPALCTVSPTVIIFSCL